MRHVAAIIAIACFASFALVAGDARRARAEGEKIVEIEVVENTKTNDETVLLIAGVEKGDRFSYALLDAIKIDLVSSGLFKDVQVIATPVPGGMKVTIIARDKHSWIIAPTFYNQPGNVGGGVGFGENNLWGQNKKLLVYAQYATADSLFLAGYLDPSISGTPLYWRVDTFLRRERVTEFTPRTGFLDQPKPMRLSTMNYLNGGLMLGVNVWKGMALDARLRGAYVSFEDAECHESVDPLEWSACDGALPQDDGWDVSSEVKLTYDKRANWYGITTGDMFRLSYERAVPDLGSDFDYWVTSAAFMHARKFWSEHNLVLKFSAGLGHHLPFQQEFTSGGVNLRGYKNRQFRGDTKIAGTVEYSVPFFKISSLAFRGLVFTDMAYTTFTQDSGADVMSTRHYLPDQTENTLEQFRLGIGAGFRIYVRSIVLPLLGLDLGYAPQADDYHIYFAVGLTEL